MKETKKKMKKHYIGNGVFIEVKTGETLGKKFQVQVQFGKTWITLKSEQSYKDALVYVRTQDTSERKYPLRIVRVVKTVMFEEKK